jgi:nucleoside 2-deoxyribosyltransferase
MRSRKIYLAARYPRMQEMKKHAKQLRAAGHQVTAQWVDGAEEEMPRVVSALMDWHDVERSNLVVSFTEPYRSANVGGGRHVEFGFAYALGIENWIVGEQETIFHCLPEIRQFSSFEAVLQALKDHQKTEQN